MSDDEVYVDAVEMEMPSASAPPPSPPVIPVINISTAKNLVELVKQLVKEQAYDGVKVLFTSAGQAPRNCATLGYGTVAQDLFVEVCVEHLNEANYQANTPLFECADELLKVIARNAPPDQLLLDLIEMIEGQKSEQVFTSTLRAMQYVLLRLGNSKPRALEWALNAVRDRIEDLPVPDYLSDGYDAQQRKLLEQNEQIQSALMHYITVGLFYEPLLCEIARPNDDFRVEYFRSCGFSRRNVLACFLVQLLGRPLCLLDLSTDTSLSPLVAAPNTYALQCLGNISAAATRVIGNPFYWLGLVEQRVRFPNPRPKAKDEQIYSANIFMNEDHLPLDALAIYYYALLVEKVNMKTAPKVYAPLFIYETCLYLSAELLEAHEPPLQVRGVLLAKHTMELLGSTEIPAVHLEQAVYKRFCLSLCGIVAHSVQLGLRKRALPLLRLFILRFDDTGKYLVLKNLLRGTTHNGLSGYLAIMYKDLVGAALRDCPGPLPACFSGADFRSMFLQTMCRLPLGAESDMLENSDAIISTLNAMRFFALNDQQNRTGFRDLLPEVESQFVAPLRNGLDLSIAHYQAELAKEGQAHVSREDLDSDSLSITDALKLLNVAIPNADKVAEALSPPAGGGGAAAAGGSPRIPQGDSDEPERQRKIALLNQYLCTFDLMRSLLARATECVEHAHNSFLACSSFAAATHLQQQSLGRSSSPRPHVVAVAVAAQQRYFSRVAASSSGSGDTSQTIDEFRAREEQREQEFEAQQEEQTQQQQKSAEDEAKRAKVDAIRARILAAALPHVPTLGWTRQAIVQGAEEVGFPSVVHGMFPEGGFALVSYFNGRCNDQLLQHLQAKTQNGQTSVADPLEFLVRAVRMRLEMVTPYKGQWSQALALIALPQNTSTALAQVLTLVDDICYYSGDRSVDFGWYTRRIGLATIFKMTELYMLQDTSPHHANTWDFLKNRMDEAVQLQMMLGQTEDMTHNFQRSFNSAFLTARNILGLGYDRR